MSEVELTRVLEVDSTAETGVERDMKGVMEVESEDSC